MKPKTLNQDTFDITLENTDGPILVDFWADWCGPCKMITPVIEELAEEQAGKAIVAKVNVDESPQLAERFGVSAIPTLIVFKNSEPVRRFQGVQSKSILAASLAEAA